MIELSPGDVIANRYTVEHEIGRGGMAVVYQVLHHQLGTPCALKVLAISARSVKARLLREGQVQAALAHPNVVSVIDVVEVGDAPGLVMELVRGPSLEQLLAHAELTLDQADDLADGIFAGMAAAHARGLIHRDLKPANILCAITDGGLVPKVSDFGLAKIMGEESGTATSTRSGTTMGTPAYMSPEQIRSARTVDKRADVFSLGAILYELVTRQRAFPGEDLLDLFNNVAAGRYRPPRELRPDLPERMDRAIRGALEPDRDQRIRDCATLRDIWNGERDEWTAEVSRDETTFGGSKWDAAILARFSKPGSTGGRTSESEVRGRATPGTGSETWVGADGITGIEELEPARATTSAVSSFPSAGRAPEREAGVRASPSRRWKWVLVPLLSLAGLLTLTTGGLSVALYMAAMAQPADAPVPAPIAVAAPVVPVPAAAPVQAPVPVVVAPPMPAPADVPAPVVRSPQPRPAPVPEPVVVAVPVPAPVPAPAPAPAPAVEPAPALLRSDRSRVSLDAGGARVWLQGLDRNYELPGEVPAGTYTIQAFFAGGEAVKVGSVTLAGGQEKKIVCSEELRKCR